MVMSLQACLWPLSRLGEGVYEIATRLGLSLPEAPPPTPPAWIRATDGVGRWLETAVEPLQLEATSIYTAYGDVPTFLETAGPAILRMPIEGDAAVQDDVSGGGAEGAADGTGEFLIVLRSQRRNMLVLAPDFTVQRLPTALVRAALCAPLEAPLQSDVAALLAIAKVPAHREERVRAAILRQRLVDEFVEGIWLLDASPGSGFGRQLLRAGVAGQIGRFMVAYTTQHFLFLLSWWLIGRALFEVGRVEAGLFWAWAFVLISLIPIRLLSVWLQGMIVTTVSGVLQKRLLYGTMRLHPDEIRHQGIGQLMGRVFEAELIGTLSIRGAAEGINGLIELVLAIVVLWFGVGGGWMAVLLIGWIGVVAWMASRFYVNRQRWTVARRRLTHGLIERMVGHRTRVAQNRPSRWHDGEDQVLSHYATIMTGLTQSAARLSVLTGRGWLLLALSGLAFFFVQGDTEPVTLAITLGGILSAELALGRIAVVFSGLIAMRVAWEEVGPLYHAAERSVVVGNPDTAVVPTTTPDSIRSHILLDAHNLSYRYARRGQSVLQRCDLRIHYGDRILLEGPSGGGKSTLASLLTGLRQPDHGLLLLQGLDHYTLGASGWRRQVVSAPQFHENHVLEATFLFNLLMGRRWPPRREDMAAAWAVCEALGLDEVINQMPGGMLQTVGERGWQLSHGECSRLFIARALLQEADLIILDESFASLDPVNLERAMRCVLDQRAAVLVIAHP